jgi:hypothetical protein
MMAEYRENSGRVQVRTGEDGMRSEDVKANVEEVQRMGEDGMR